MAPIRCCCDQTAVWHSDAARGPSTPSFDHLVGEREQRGRHVDGKRLGGLSLDLRFSPTGSDASCSVQNQRSPWSPLIRLLSGGSSMRFHCWSLSMSSRLCAFIRFASSCLRQNLYHCVQRQVMLVRADRPQSHRALD